ncbi:hypothetical protein [Exiguobacterium indicum]|uniref:hypothetical protein n=1 Tax=Exiguobacterium indicum TaxID=296995 RepID=UPI0033149AE1
MDERVKKPFKWGERTQKMMSFKVDLDLAERLVEVRNKGRLINNLLREYFEKPANLGKEKEGDIHPDANTIEEYMK